MNRARVDSWGNESTRALRYAQSAARQFVTDIEELEAGSKLALSVGYIQNRLSDADDSLPAGEQEIQGLIPESSLLLTPPVSRNSTPMKRRDAREAALL